MPALYRGGEDRTDKGARRGSGDPLRFVAGIHQGGDGPDQTDAFDSTAGEDQVCALVRGRHHQALTGAGAFQSPLSASGLGQ